MSSVRQSAAVSGDVLPIRGTRDQAPSSLLIRSALASAGITDGSTIRAAVAVVFALADDLRDQGGTRGPSWTTELTHGTSWLCARTGLPASAIRSAVDALLHAALLEGSTDRYRISAEPMVELPALARLEIAGIRAALEGAAGRVAPCLAVVRELAKRADHRAASWIEYSIPELTAETHFGRTAVCDALATLERAGVIERAPTAGGSGTLRARIAGQLPARTASPAPPSPAPQDQGYVLSIGGARLKVGPGLTAAVAMDSDGTIVVSVDPAP